MERKNTILLTVIAIATLLVAVVGATFAYFTAQFNVNNDEDANKKVEIQPTTVAPVYPGYQIVKALHVTGSGDGNAASVKVNITGSIGENMGKASHVKITIYKGTEKGENTEVSFSSKPVTQTEGSTTKYYDAGELATGSASKVSSAEWTQTEQTVSRSFTINNITGTTNVYYFVVVEYINDNTQAQDAEKEETISLTLTAEAIDVNVAP